jgi:hypothetical protein
MLLRCVPLLAHCLTTYYLHIVSLPTYLSISAHCLVLAVCLRFRGLGLRPSTRACPSLAATAAVTHVACRPCAVLRAGFGAGDSVLVIIITPLMWLRCIGYCRPCLFGLAPHRSHVVVMRLAIMYCRLHVLGRKCLVLAVCVLLCVHACIKPFLLGLLPRKLS